MLDEVNRLKEENKADQEELQCVKGTKARLAHVADTEITSDEFFRRISQNPDNATIQDKRLALDALDILITASAQRIDIKGVIPIEPVTPSSSDNVTTTGQTSGRTEHHRKLHVLISAEIREHKLAGQTLLLA